METFDWDRAFIRRSERLAELLRINAPPQIIAREVFMIVKAMRHTLDDGVIEDARFEIETDPAWDDENIKGVG